MRGVHVELQGDSREVLEELATGFGQRVENDRLVMPEFIGAGFCKAYTLGNGISAIVSRCCYKVDFVLKGINTGSPVFILQFDNVNHCQPENAVVLSEEGKEEYSDLTFALSNATQEQLREKGQLVRSLKIFIRGDWIEKVLGGGELYNQVSDLLASFPEQHFHSPLSAEERLWLREIFVTDHHTAWDDFYSVIRIKLLLESFIVRLRRQLAGESVRQFSEHEREQLKQAESRLLSNFSGPAPTINTLAREAGMSPSKFKADFRDMFGLPVYQYYQRNRMMYARSLMESRKISVKEIGTQVGYSNLSHFSAAFRKEFGMLPKELQEVLKEQKRAMAVRPSDN